MPTQIKNPSTEPVSLPFPFVGTLRGGQAIVLNLDIALVSAALGATPFIVSEAPLSGRYDDAYEGYAGGNTFAVPGGALFDGDVVTTGALAASGDLTVAGENIQATSALLQVNGISANADIATGNGFVGNSAAFGAQTLDGFAASLDYAAGAMVIYEGLSAPLSVEILAESVSVGAQLFVRNADPTHSVTFDDVDVTVLAPGEFAIFAYFVSVGWRRMVRV